MVGREHVHNHESCIKFFLEHVGELCIIILRRKGGVLNPIQHHTYTLQIIQRALSHLIKIEGP
jgi:hypothetical protein